eukprot:15442426-Alexandrium_andersonii.AAC.1
MSRSSGPSWPPGWSGLPPASALGATARRGPRLQAGRPAAQRLRGTRRRKAGGRGEALALRPSSAWPNGSAAEAR